GRNVDGFGPAFEGVKPNAQVQRQFADRPLILSVQAVRRNAQIGEPRCGPLGHAGRHSQSEYVRESLRDSRIYMVPAPKELKAGFEGMRPGYVRHGGAAIAPRQGIRARWAVSGD